MDCNAALHPGMVMSAIELVEKNSSLSERDIREGLEGNICRCTGYHNIVKAVQSAAEKNEMIRGKLCMQHAI